MLEEFWFCTDLLFNQFEGLSKNMKARIVSERFKDRGERERERERERTKREVGSRDQYLGHMFSVIPLISLTHCSSSM